MTWTTPTDAVASEGGVVVLDEESSLGARITLERDGGTAPWAITCGIYGFMVHTVFCSDEAAARTTYAEMKAELERMLQLPDDQMTAAAGAFVDRF